ncbi:MAG: hypothetical protein LW696_07085 [Alphaproteobacteria bacterium]|nr:hypothetical protein [Alphaproteobacteria bacterium]
MIIFLSFIVFSYQYLTASYDVSTIAGGGMYPGDGGFPTSAVVSSPAGVFVDSNNTTYIADTNNHRIRMIWGPASNGTYTQGSIYTIAGTGSSGFSGDGGAATSALLNAPRSVKVDNAGNIFVADYNNNRIRKFTLGGIISTVAGGINVVGDTLLPTAAVVNSPGQVVLDALNNIYIADTSNHRIRMVWMATSNTTYTQGNMYTIAGTGAAGNAANGIAATSAPLSSPRGVQVDSLGNIYIADYGNHCIRRFILGGTISTIAGTAGSSGFSGDGGAATAALLNGPTAFFVDALRNVYIADQNNRRIRLVPNITTIANGVTYTAGNIYTIAGTGVAGFSGDGGAATAATFGNTTSSSPTGVCVDSLGRIFVADQGNNRIRMFTLGGNISTVAGGGNSVNNGVATSSLVSSPQNVFVDSSNNVYIAELGGARIRKFTVGGNISTIAGTGTQGYNGDGIAATSAQIRPFNVYVDSSQNVYIADWTNNRIRKFQVGGTISTIVGTGSTTYIGDGGLATNAALNAPTNFCVDNTGNIYIADQNNHRIRMVWNAASNGTYTQGNIYTVAGIGSATYNGDGILATSAAVNSPGGVFVDNSNRIYVADCQNHRIRMFTLGGAILTIAGNGATGYSGDGGAAISATMNLPQDVFVDGIGRIYVADLFGNNIRMFTLGGAISTIAGNGTAAYNGDGIPATAAQLRPFGIYVDNSQNVYVAEWTNTNRIRRFQVGGNISTIAGNGTTTYTGDGNPAGVALLNNPRGIFRDSAGNTYFADTSNNRIRRIDAMTGIITTIAGTGSAGYSGDGGLATAAMINAPYGVCLDSSGSVVYVAESNGHRIRKININTGIITTIAGTGTAGYSGDGGSATSAMINTPYGIWPNSSGDIYFADLNNARIRKVDINTGIITTVAGTGTVGYSGDGGPSASAKLNSPWGICIDNTGNIYIADTGNIRVRMIWNAASNTTYTQGNIYTVAGNGGSSYSGEGGLATAASLGSLWGVCTDSAGKVYIAGYLTNSIRVFSLGGNITTIAGTGIAGFSGDGGPATSAKLNAPRLVFADNSRDIYISDTGNNRIRMLFSNNTYSVPPGSTQTISDTATQPVIIGGGTAVLPPSNSVTSVEVANGTLQVSSSAPVTFNATPGGSAVVQVTASTNTGAYNFATAGSVQVNAEVVANLSVPPAGSGVMSKVGPGSIEATSDLSSSTTPIAVLEGTLEVSGTNGKLPNAAISVENGAVLQLGDVGSSVTHGAVPGTSNFKTGSTLFVPQGVQVPNDALSNATIHSGVTLKFGNGARVTQPVNVVA